MKYLNFNNAGSSRPYPEVNKELCDFLEIENIFGGYFAAEKYKEKDVVLLAGLTRYAVLPLKSMLVLPIHNYSDNNILISKDIDISDIPEFGSKIFLLDEIFKDFTFKDNYYVSVLVEHNSAFPRLVVGNLHKEDDFLEVTHSFPVIEEIDHVTVDQSKFDFESILCG